MAVTIEVKEGETGQLTGPAGVRVIANPDSVMVDGNPMDFPRFHLADGEVAEVTGPATMRVVSDVPGSALIDGEPVGPTSPPAPDVAPSISLLTPNTAVAGDATDITMVVEGAGFNAYSVIVFNGLDELTVFIDDTQVSTGVKPSLFVVPADCPVAVRNGAEISNELTFSFTDPATRRRS